VFIVDLIIPFGFLVNVKFLNGVKVFTFPAEEFDGHYVIFSFFFFFPK
jgi:hypothetical protein